MKNILKSLVVITTVAALVTTNTMAAFTARATIHNSTFSTGTASLKFLNDLSIDNPATDPGFQANLSAGIPTGPVFNNIIPNWTMDYSLKLYNAGTINLIASALGVFVSDTSDLRTQVYVQALAWNDVDSDGVVDVGEVGSSYGAPMTLEDWRTNAITFGQINTNTVMPIILRFSTGDLDGIYQGQNTVFDFQFDGTTTGATNP